MSTSDATLQSTAGITSATFEPTVSPSTVILTGYATGANYIAGIELYDGTTDLGGIGGFATTNSGFSFTATLPAGTHDIHAVVTELTGLTYGIFAPFQIVTGIKNQPYTYQERNENGAGLVTSVDSYDAAGSLVSHSTVALNGGSAAPFTIAFDPSTTFVGTTEATLTGTTSAYGSAADIEIYDGSESSVIDPKTGKLLASALLLGPAAVNADGTWSFDAHVSPGYHQFTAVATSMTDQEAVAQSPFALQTGVVGQPYVFREIDYGAGGAVAATKSYAADGSIAALNNDGGLTVNGGSATGAVVRSQYDDVMTGDGTGSTTFLFRPGFGQDEITNFNFLPASQSDTGVSHDIINLPRSIFANLVAVLHHTTTALDGDAVIHLNRTDSITLDGVTKADLVTHQNVFRFHN